MKINGRLIAFTFLLVAMTTACKYFFGPDLAWSGFSPVMAIALFSGFMMKERNATFLLPLIALFLSDALIQLFYAQGWFPYEGFYSGQWKNYLLLLSLALIGWGLKGRSYSTLGIGAIAAPTVFFLVSNFMVWQSVAEAPYTKDFNGLLDCYAAGLPFYKNALISTIIFLPITLLLYNYLAKNKTRLVMA